MLPSCHETNGPRGSITRPHRASSSRRVPLELVPSGTKTLWHCLCLCMISA
ncbi:hypothetical protein RB3301 [Rhodopirellula baltica SH 1]|uniref:Uncharacterized protein n=1 Tax=Rhodopirellula baltica (strain DSM 10527 / NCIMB 13988 / SH1) TaxID=243090 RepID=Q7UUG8_RHOBA|nr:hypothetical protein RB3301 [Rhodopirellula baltica SH 1]